MTIELSSVQVVLAIIIGISSVVGIVYASVRAIATPTINEKIAAHLKDCPMRDVVAVETKTRQDAISRIERGMERIESRLDEVLMTLQRRATQ